MKFTVEMLAFGELGKAQIVEVPIDELAGASLCQLETVFQCMQAAPHLYRRRYSLRRQSLPRYRRRREI